MDKILKIKDFFVSIDDKIDDKKVVKDFNLSINKGCVHAIMGPNGSGKSSLAYSLMGHPSYKIMGGEIIFLGENITNLAPDKRANLGMFLAFQYPCEISGATVFSVLKELYTIKTKKLITVAKFTDILFENMDILGIDYSFAKRALNEGFSGGEKKKFEILQMLILKPKFLILDEIDSGLDIDALKIVSAGILKAQENNPDMGILIITHYSRILKYIMPDFVHIMCNGKIKKTGGPELIEEIEKDGYARFISQEG